MIIDHNLRNVTLTCEVSIVPNNNPILLHALPDCFPHDKKAFGRQMRIVSSV